MVHACNDAVWGAFEESLVPPQWKVGETNLGYTVKIIKNAASALVLLPVGMFTGYWVGIAKILSSIGNFFYKPVQGKVFSLILENSKHWEQVDVTKALLEHPLGEDDIKFLLGVATCTYQDSGISCPDAQWASWEKKIIKDEKNRSGEVNLFELYKTPEGRKLVIDRLKSLHVNAFRVSVDWSQIQPKETEWRDDMLDIYVAFLKDLKDNGISPMVTLHHFAEPAFFHEKGSFEKEENHQLFVDFAKKVVVALTQNYKGSPLVKHFCTINEPNVEAFSRFVWGSFSPGITFNYKRAGAFLMGAFKAHAAVYNELKKIAPKEVKIGITHQYLRFVPTNFLMRPMTRYLTRLTNDATLHYYKTGNFELKIPFLCNIQEKMPVFKADFVGLQNYVRPVIGLKGPTNFGEPMTQMPFREDPASLYEAIVETYNACKKPIIVTENGISTHDEAQRSRYLARALYAAKQASITIGEKNLQGYFLWCFLRNLEWDMGMRPQNFGAFDWKNGTIAERYNPGVEPFVQNNIKAQKISVSEVKVA